MLVAVETIYQSMIYTKKLRDTKVTMTLNLRDSAESSFMCQV
jgi:hypothetical protein